MGESDLQQREIRVKGTDEQMKQVIEAWSNRIYQQHRGRLQGMKVYPFDSRQERIQILFVPTPEGSLIVGEGAAKDWAALGDLWDELRAELEPWAVDAEPKPKGKPGPKVKPKFYWWAAVEIGNKNRDPNAVFDEWYRLLTGADPDDLNASNEEALRKKFKQALKERGTIFEWPIS